MNVHAYIYEFQIKMCTKVFFSESFFTDCAIVVGSIRTEKKKRLKDGT